MAGKTEATLNSLIGEKSAFEGKFYIAGSLKIDGRFEGEVKTDDELIVGETGQVKTDIIAKSVIVAGVVIGNIEADEEVKLLATGKVLGNITALKVSVENGVLVSGEINIHSGQKTDVEKIIQDAYTKGGSSKQFLSQKKDDNNKHK